MDLRDADHGALQRVDVAAGDGLQAGDDLRRRDDRVDAEMRHRRMRAAPVTVISKMSNAAIIGPGRIANSPAGSPGQLCMPYTASTG